MSHEEPGYVVPTELLPSEDFFSKTFGDIISQNLMTRAKYDALYKNSVLLEPFHYRVETTSIYVYGTGERTFGLNLYGRKLTFWNTDAGSYDRGLEPINYTIPFLVIVEEKEVKGIFVDNMHRGTVDIGYTTNGIIEFSFEGPARGVHTFTGTTVNDVIAQFTQHTGRMPMQPLWSLGHQQCRYSYMNQQEVLDLAKQFRERNIPCDVIYLDIHYMDNYKVFTWDKKAFPDFKGMIDQLHTMGFRLVVILDPGVKVEQGYVGYDNGIEEDVFVKYPDGTLVEGVVWPGVTHHPDFANSRVRQWWAKQVRPLLEAGVDGIWNDMNEPLYFGIGEAISPQDYVMHDVDGVGAPHATRHNLYGHDMATASRLALETYRPNTRPFNITRSGYAGTQAVASSWTGDNKSTWDDLRISIPMNLNLALSGQSFTGPDIGGFARDTTPELVVRWYQACVLFPFYRNHSAVDTIYQEAWRFGERAENIIRQAIELRYTLLPYLYSVLAECHFEGTPIMRPIFTLDSANPHVRNVDDCYLVGDNILVAPVLEEITLRRMVYLPADADWWTLDGKTHYKGGQFISVEAPLDTVPIFVRAGTALPMWEAQQHLGQAPTSVNIRVYGGQGTTRVYQDAGEGLGYLNGEYAWTTFTVNGNKVTSKVEGNSEYSKFTILK
jgi:alpha-glucosidase